MGLQLSSVQNEIKTQYLIPERIMLQKNAQNAEILLTEHPRQAFLGKMPVCTIKKGGSILLDFGCEFQGGADIVVQAIKNGKAKLRVVFGESASEALSTIGEKNATNDHSPRDFIVDVPDISHITIGNTGYRFLKLEAKAGDISISSVQGVSRFRDLEYRGTFNCSDERLNEIWHVGARTVHLNMQEYLWDGIKRDRLVWVGDMHPEISTVSMVFGETDVVKKTLDFVRDNTSPDSFMNTFASYSMWWLKIHRDLFWDSGDLKYLGEQKEYIKSLLKNILSHINDDGCCNIRDKFVEWSNKDAYDEETAFYAVLVMGLTAGSELLGILGGSDELAVRCTEAIERIKARNYVLFGNKQAAAMAGLCGLKDIKNVCSKIIRPGGAKGLSAFWGYYVLQALDEAGETEFALEVMRRYWGGMLDMGATTFWEDFDIDWAENAFRIDELPQEGKKDVHGDCGRFCYTKFRHSLCHGWASGPTSFLSRRILGVKPAEPGYKKIIIEPHLGSLDYAEGKIPTPHGVIAVHHEKTSDGVKTNICVPDGVEVVKNMLIYTRRKYEVH